jgi:rSAM/selenodomain-associated transferase 2
MRVSAIIPALDEEAEIAAAVASARAAGADEVIVADGGSADATSARARSASADRVLMAPRGRGSQLSAGADAARGEAFWFLHADARAPAGAANALREALAAGADWGAFRIRHDADGWAIRLADRRSHRTSLPYGDQGVFCSRQAYEQVGGMPQQELMEDLEFASHLRQLFGPPARLPIELKLSARRFAARPVRSALCWWTFPALYRLGVAPARLARWYGAAGYHS